MLGTCEGLWLSKRKLIGYCWKHHTQIQQNPFYVQEMHPRMCCSATEGTQRNTALGWSSQFFQRLLLLPQCLWFLGTGLVEWLCVLASLSWRSTYIFPQGCLGTLVRKSRWFFRFWHPHKASSLGVLLGHFQCVRLFFLKKISWCLCFSLKIIYMLFNYPLYKKMG